MTDVAEAAPGGRGYVRLTLPLMRKILGRVACGETLSSICRDPGMPSRNSLTRWAQERPTFGRALAKARAAGERLGVGGRSNVCPTAAAEIYQRMCQGESLSAICRDPDMPQMSTVNLWRRRDPQFDAAMRLAREVQAERLCDLGLEMAGRATPKTAYLTHVQLSQLRWTAAHLAPRRFNTRRAEPETAQDEPLTVAIRTYRGEEDPETGKMRVVSYIPNPLTGKMERLPTPVDPNAPGLEELPDSMRDHWKLAD